MLWYIVHLWHNENKLWIQKDVFLALPTYSQGTYIRC